MTIDFESEWEQEAVEAEPFSAPQSARSPPMSSAQLHATIQRHRSAYAKLAKAVAAMRPHIVVRNGRAHFTLPARSTHEAAVRLGIDPLLFSHLHTSLKRSPPLVRSSRPARKGEMEWESPGPCAGVTDYDSHWWGFRVLLDDCKTGALASWLKGGAATAGGCAVIVPVPQVKLVCAALAAAGSAMGYYIEGVNAYGGRQGVRMTWTWPQLLDPVMGVAPIVLPQ